MKFWSGQTLTADDVIASYRAAMDNASSPYHSRLAEVQSIEKAGTYQVRIVLSSPNAAFPRLLNIPIYREGSADSGSFADGTGPYVPVENGSVCTLEKNENWHGGFLGTIRHITLVGITRADAAETSFRTGDVSVQRSARIAADDKATVIGGAVDTYQTPSTTLHYIGINHANEQLKNANVRRRFPPPSAAARSATPSFRPSPTRRFCRSIRSSRFRAFRSRPMRMLPGRMRCCTGTRVPKTPRILRTALRRTPQRPMLPPRTSRFTTLTTARL